MPPRLSAVLITRNEESRIEACLRALGFADEKIVVDAMSSDATVRLAERCGARVFRREFDQFAAQKNFAVAQASGDWVLSVDADETVTPELALEIRAAVGSASGDAGYYLRRTNFIFGRRMRFGACAGDKQLRLFRRGAGEFFGEVHERVRLTGRAGALKSELLHHSTATIGDYLRRLESYTLLEARMLHRQGRRPTAAHLFLKPAAEFLYYYFGRLGLLDGCPGFQYQILSSVYTYLKYARTAELFSNTAVNTTIHTKKEGTHG
jgi:glycosyltransferase involved in cell wall biosynthesis